MMASLSDSEEEQFFDLPEEIDCISNCDSEQFVNCPTNFRVSDRVSNDFSYEFWNRIPESVYDRRSRFFEQMGLSLNENMINKKESRKDISSDGIDIDMDRINLDSGAILRNSSSDYSLFSGRSSLACPSTEEEDLLAEYALESNFLNKVGDLNVSSEFSTDGVGKSGAAHKSHEVGLNRLVNIGKFRKSGKNHVTSWLKKLRQKVRNKDAKEEASPKDGAQLRSISVRMHKKRLKELSFLYEGQDFCAHEGLILAMKFSPDGRFLGTAGEDGVVRVWKVIEEEREDLSSLYFSVNHFSKLVPIDFGKEENFKMKSFRKSTKPGCVIFPPKVFRIAEEPLYELRGHCGQVLALSWSSNECLLTSSVDNSVRLWQVGHDECLKVFPHNNYVTCIEFNPVDDNYFISGSIDGKVRIWEVSGCRVVDWIDIREIVTAVCYYPSGKRGIVGSMDGSCRFYVITDNQLQLDTQIFLPGKKKLPCKRITGFQISSSDSSKVLVTSADSQVRVLSGSDVIFKLKGSRMSGCQVTAVFTEDGNRIVSGSEDSNIHVWDLTTSHNSTSSSKVNIIESRESFISPNSFIALPWCGIRTKSTLSFSDPSPGSNLPGSILLNVPCDNDLSSTIPSSLPDCFSMGHGILLESWLKGPATWPEEKLANTYLPPSVNKSDFKVLKGACQSKCSSHTWGLVIVTAGRDGWIRTYHNHGLPIHT